MGLTWWDEADGTRLYLLDGSVQLAEQEEQARLHAAGDESVGTPMFGVNASDGDRAMVEAAGYRVAFTRVRMQMPLTEPSPVALPPGLELRPASAADHRAVFGANAEVFGASALGYIQDTFEGFETDVAEDFPEYDLWTLAWDGDRLVGWVISGVDDTPWVGVRADWRRRGLASALLRTNQSQLWQYGVRETSLWTILENPTGSVALYESLGYRIIERQPRYRKPF